MDPIQPLFNSQYRGCGQKSRPGSRVAGRAQACQRAALNPTMSDNAQHGVEPLYEQSVYNAYNRTPHEQLVSGTACRHQTPVLAVGSVTRFCSNAYLIKNKMLYEQSRSPVTRIIEPEVPTQRPTTPKQTTHSTPHSEVPRRAAHARLDARQTHNFNCGAAYAALHVRHSECGGRNNAISFHIHASGCGWGSRGVGSRAHAPHRGW
jgi:hypothetical protein